MDSSIPINFKKFRYLRSLLNWSWSYLCLRIFSLFYWLNLEILRYSSLFYLCMVALTNSISRSLCFFFSKFYNFSVWSRSSLYLMWILDYMIHINVYIFCLFVMKTFLMKRFWSLLAGLDERVIFGYQFLF